ncbi:MAG: hypothetical protein D6730_03315 [Bacteroidetes bacterium]|nr:MAG: hypothetical protein D6730_03315 [Bacteroidota bacterium]
MEQDFNKIAFAWSVLSLLFSCDPGYSCYLQNTTGKKLSVTTSPSITEIMAMPSQAMIDSTGVLCLEKNHSLLLFGYIGFAPHEEDFPYEYMEISTASDTIFFKSKKEILQSLQQRRNSRKYYLKIDSLE